MVVQHDISAQNTQRMLSITARAQIKSMEKLSSGYRINRAADDASGLSISEKMRRVIRGLMQASENTQDGISMSRTADGAMGEVADMLQRLNELAIKASNGTLSAGDRQSVNEEAVDLVSEIDRVGTTTRFNELYLMNGHGGADHRDVGIQAGSESGEDNRITVRLEKMNSETLGIGDIDMTTAEHSRASIMKITDAIKLLSEQRSSLGAYENRLSYARENLDNIVENTVSAESKLRDTDFASEILKKKKNDILQEMGMRVIKKAAGDRASGSVADLISNSTPAAEKAEKAPEKED